MQSREKKNNYNMLEAGFSYLNRSQAKDPLKWVLLTPDGFETLNQEIILKGYRLSSSFSSEILSMQEPQSNT